MIRLVSSLLLLLVLLLPGNADAQSIPLPVEVRKGPVLVRAEAGLKSDAKRLAAEAPDMLARIAVDLPELPTPSSVEIRLVKKSEDLAKVAPAGRGAPKWAVGVAYRGTNVVSVARRRDSNPVDIVSTTAHELAHLALDTAMSDVHIPRWLNEGFAYLHSSDFSMARTQTLTGMAWTGDVIPLVDLDSSFPAREMAAHRAYAQSYDFVAFLARRGRFSDTGDDGDRWPFRDFIAELAKGATLDEAANAHFAAPMSRLYQEWLRSMKERYMLSPIGLFGILVWAIGGVLLVFAYLRKRRLNRRKMSQWEEEESPLQDPATPPDPYAPHI